MGKNFLKNLLVTLFLGIVVPGCQPHREAKVTVPVNNRHKFVATVIIDDKFDRDERKVISNALRDWEYATDDMLEFDVINDVWRSGDRPFYTPRPDPETGVVYCTRDIYVSRVLSTDRRVKDIEATIQGEVHGGFDLAGYANPGCVSKWIMLVADRVSSEVEYRTLVIHEVGHILGMQHIDSREKKTVMFPTLEGSATCITDTDMRQFCRGWSCEGYHPRPCQPDR